MLDKTGMPEIQKAVVILHEMSLDEEVQEMARLREKWILDENSALGNARRSGVKEGLEKGKKEGLEEGKKEGLEKGKKEKETEMIEKMRKSGMSEEQVQKVLNA